MTIEETITAAVADAVENVLPRVLRQELAAAMARASADPEQLVDVEEAAKKLGMSVGAVRKAVERGSLPAVRVGRRVRLRIGDLLALSKTR